MSGFEQYHAEVLAHIGLKTMGDKPSEAYTREEHEKGTEPDLCAQMWVEDWAAELSEREHFNQR